MLYYSVLLYWSCGHRWGAQGPNLRRTVSSCVSSEETWQPGWATSLKRSTSFPCALVMAVLGMKLSGEKWRELLGDMVVSRHIYSIYNNIIYIFIYLYLFICLFIYLYLFICLFIYLFIYVCIIYFITFHHIASYSIILDHKQSGGKELQS